MATNPKTHRFPTQVANQDGAHSSKALTSQKTKKERLQALLRRKGGVSIVVLQKELGWQSHTVRAAISGVRKAGETVECTFGKASSVYRIVKSTAAQ